jgi:RNA polymerase sigma-70 factor (ECF subfamily)
MPDESPKTNAVGEKKDTALLTAAQNGDRSAFDTLVDRYRSAVVGYCRTMLCTHDDASDAAQDVFTRAWNGISAYRGDASLKTWLFTISRNHCLNILRSSRETLSLAAVDPSALSEPGFADTADNHILHDYVIKAIKETAESRKPPWKALDYSIFFLYYDQELDLREIAAFLNCNYHTVRSRYYRTILPVIESVRVRLDK